MDNVERQLVELMTDHHYQTCIRKAGSFRFPSNYRFESHSHPEYEINYINAGTCLMEVEGSYVPLKAGECIVVAPEKAHCFMVDVSKACKITQLELVIRCPEMQEKVLEFPVLSEDYHRLRECEQLVPLLERISYYFRAGQQEGMGKVQIDLMLLQMYALLSEAIGKSRRQAVTEEPDRVKRIIRHIQENLDGELNLERLSAQQGISSRYVRKYFEQQMGMGANEYITMLRIGKAKRLLWDREHSVTEVALMSGFSSSQYFCKVFHKHLGVTPAEYRRRWQTEASEDGGNI